MMHFINLTSEHGGIVKDLTVVMEVTPSELNGLKRLESLVHANSDIQKGPLLHVFPMVWKPEESGER